MRALDPPADQQAMVPTDLTDGSPIDVIVDPLAETTTALVNSPQFDAAAMVYTDHHISFRRQLGFLNRIGTNVAFHCLHYIIYMHYAHAADADRPAPTFSNLVGVMKRREQCGDRALRTILLVTKAAGLVCSQPSDGDRRITVYSPSERLRADLQANFAASMRLVDMIIPGSDFAQRVEDESGFFEHLIVSAGREVVEHDVQITEPYTDLHTILNQVGGLPTALSFVAAALRQETLPPMNSIAKDFKISRSQVRNIVGQMTDRGLVTRTQSGQLKSCARLLASYRGVIARELALFCKFSLGLSPHNLRV